MTADQLQAIEVIEPEPADAERLDALDELYRDLMADEWNRLMHEFTRTPVQA